MKFIVFVKNNQSGVTYHRLTTPFRYIEQLGHKVDYFTDYSQFNPRTSSIDEYDCLVFNRSVGGYMQDSILIKRFKAKGKKFILDLDDYWNLEAYHPIVWRDDINYDSWRGNIISNIHLADIIWTTTEELKQEIQKITDCKVVIAKNAIDKEEKQWRTEAFSKKRLQPSIGYIGSSSHYMDIDIMRYVGRGLRKNKVKFDFSLFGYSPKAPDHFQKVWKHQVDVLTDSDNSPIRIYKGVQVNIYAHLYDFCDITIAPLRNSLFNACKSELKVLESGAKRKPIVCSDIVTYSRTEANIDLCSNADDWIRSLKELVNDRELREELGEELYEYTFSSYNILKESEKRLNSI